MKKSDLPIYKANICLHEIVIHKIKTTKWYAAALIKNAWLVFEPFHEIT